MESIHSTHDASVAVFSYMHRFSLSMMAQQHLLDLIRLLLPVNNKLPKNLNQLTKEIGLDKMNIDKKPFVIDAIQR